MPTPTTNVPWPCEPRWPSHFETSLRTWTSLITPTTPGPAFRVGEKADDPIAMYLCDLYTVAANLVGTPVISIPAGRSKDGLPLGVQLWGKKGSEKTLLALASYLEATSPACAYVAPTLGGTA